MQSECVYLHGLNRVDTNERGKWLGGLAGLASGLSPMNSFTFIVALGVSALAGFLWFKESGDPRPPFPTYGTVAVSYAGGFLVGRLVRAVLRTAAIAVAIVLAGLAIVKCAHVDTGKAKQTVEAGSGWIREHADRISDDLLRLLPSGGAAGLGVLAGGRRRRIKAG